LARGSHARLIAVIEQTAASDEEEGLRRWWGSQVDGTARRRCRQTRFPAITVPAGFKPGGFPVAIGLLGRPLAETASSP